MNSAIQSFKICSVSINLARNVSEKCEQNEPTWIVAVAAPHGGPKGSCSPLTSRQINFLVRPKFYEKMFRLGRKSSYKILK